MFLRCKAHGSHSRIPNCWLDGNQIVFHSACPITADGICGKQCACSHGQIRALAGHALICESDDGLIGAHDNGVWRAKMVVACVHLSVYFYQTPPPARYFHVCRISMFNYTMCSRKGLLLSSRLKCELAIVETCWNSRSSHEGVRLEPFKA
jgi:hypothetical protein